MHHELVWVGASPLGRRGPQVRAPWHHGAMGPSTSWDQWPRPVTRAVVGAQECTQIGQNGLSAPFWGICVHYWAARVARVVTQAASGGMSTPTTMTCRRRPLDGQPLPWSGKQALRDRLCVSGAIVRLVSSQNVNPHKPPRSVTQTREEARKTQRTICRVRFPDGSTLR